MFGRSLIVIIATVAERKKEREDKDNKSGRENQSHTIYKIHGVRLSHRIELIPPRKVLFTVLVGS